MFSWFFSFNKVLLEVNIMGNEQGVKTFFLAMLKILIQSMEMVRGEVSLIESLIKCLERLCMSVIKEL